MSGNLNLEMRLTANAGQLSNALNTAGAHVRTFTNNASSAARNMAQGFQKVYQQLNGFSTISKLAVAAGGYSILSDALRRNLEFEKSLLDMKQTAQMTVQQAAEMRSLAIDAASRNMALPSEIAAGMKAFSAAGMKYESIAPSIEEAASAAVAFRSTVEQIANLDFDLQDKMKIDPSDMKTVHNMMLYHAKSGRFEAAPMALEAPKYLNSAASVGITGIAGLNFIGAMTQKLMKLAPSTQPSEVSTFMEHGFGHITSERYVKGLAKFGINVKKYMPNGKFYGEGGVGGMMELAAEMKTKGLDNPFKLDKAGFRDMYTKKFWKQVMEYQDDLKKAIAEGEKNALDDMGGRDKAEIMGSNYGKFKQMEIAKEKGALSDGATNAVGKLASLEAWAAENPGKAFAGGVGAAIGGMWLKKKLSGGGGGVLEKAMGGISGAGMPVTVTNWPAKLGGGTTLDRLSGPSGAANGAAGGAAAGAGASAALLAGTVGSIALGGAAASVAALQATQANKEKINDMARTALGGAMAGDHAVAAAILTASEAQATKTHEGFEKFLDRMSASVIEMMGGVAERPIEVQIDGHAVATAVNNANGRDARRQ